MLKISYTTNGINLHRAYYFATRPDRWRLLPYTRYRNCRDVGEIVGFTRLPLYTSLIDLSLEPGRILSACNKTTSYEINRAKRDGVTVENCADFNAFICFFNAFAALKGLKPLTAKMLSPYEGHFRILQASHQGKVLGMNLYLLDHEAGRVRLFYSASHFRRNQQSEVRNSVGRANRLLHWEAMMHFKALGIGIYDLGGLAPFSADSEWQSVSRFKEGFGGDRVCEANYYPWPLGPLFAAHRHA